MRLTITPLAEQDLEAIADYIAADNIERALTFTVELREQCRRIASNARGYRRRAELGSDIRSCSYGNYVIFFAAGRDEVTVIRVLHGARDFPTIFDSGEPEV
ncbi:type II toxin-antitoxin system RelE/ParE family toxin [Cupriavidus sp. CuC1]|uniref:type II toxin-antitoxin system RelE/ParE family toxin n=1 Tax=Cupriavidus sp. CuC1 TaxID=3373131 RepID=UPI0037D6E888